jgi:hypothetical protein
MTTRKNDLPQRLAQFISRAQSSCSVATALILGAYLCYFIAAMASGHPDAFDARHADIRPGMVAAIASVVTLLAVAIGVEIFLLGRDRASPFRMAMNERNDMGSAKSPVFIAERKANFDLRKAREAHAKAELS